MFDTLKQIIHGQDAQPITDGDIDGARERLKKALAQRPQAEAQLAEAQEALQRARAVISEADIDESLADDFASDASDAAREWAKKGSRPEHSGKADAAAAKAQQQAAKAQQSRMRADGVVQALPDLQEAERTAQIAVDTLRHDIQYAVGEILVASIAPAIAQLNDAAVQYTEAYETIESLRQVLRHWGPAHRWSELSSGHGPMLETILKAAQIRVRDATDLRPQSETWADMARRLRTNPDEEL